MRSNPSPRDILVPPQSEADVHIRDFQDLIVWQKSVDLIVQVYEVTRRFPAEEKFGMTSQVRRSATSIASNIAEGNGRGTTKDYLNYLTNSRGSQYETRSHLIVSQRLGFVSEAINAPLFERIDEVGRMTSTLRTTLRKRVR